jgi:hypothetical protein
MYNFHLKYAIASITTKVIIDVKLKNIWDFLVCQTYIPKHTY